MSKKSLLAIFITGGMIASTASYADHNSIWGPGSANMPNDIHNTRIEDSDDEFMDLVQYGGGADSVNRYLNDDLDTWDMGSRSTVVASGISTRSSGMSRAGGGRR